MIGEYLRLAFATAIVLLPGFLVARALGQRSVSAGLAWAFLVLFAAWAVVFAAHGTIRLAAGILAGTGVSAGVIAVRGLVRPDQVLPEHEDRPDPVLWGRRAVGLAGVIFGLVLWHVEGAVTGDALFHEARVRKLVELKHLHLRSVDDLFHGGLHPGYAFPLWHGFLALVAKVSRLDPSIVLHHEASVLVPIAFVVAWEAGLAVFGSVTGGFSVLAASVALYCLAAGHGGAYVSLALPATASRQILVLAGFALFFAYADSGRLADLIAFSAAFGAIVLVHPTYALFALIPLVAYSLVRWRDWKRSGLALAAALVPVGVSVLWLRPLVNETLSVNPSDQLQSSTLAKYGGELAVYSVHRFRLAAEVPGRTGAVAVAALALVPLAGLAAKRRWGAFVLGGAIAVLALMLIPELFTRFSNAVSLSQSRRAAGFLPFAFAFAGGLALLARSVWVLPFALAAGIVLERHWPGDFAYGLRNGGPGAVTWFALAGGAIALVIGLVAARNRPKERYGLGALAALLFVLPVAVHGFRQWTPLNKTDTHALSPQLLTAVQKLPNGAVVIADPETSYRIAAAAPVYVVAAPVPHVANTRANDPAARVADVKRWLATGDPAIPRRYGAGWAVVKGRLVRLPS
jgi:hypothetical protein